MSERNVRILGGADKDDPDDTRTCYERDRDRILYSYEWRRLSGVSQVAAVAETHLLHNRQMHSLKVGQLGRRFAERLVRKAVGDERQTEILRDCGGIDPDVVETAGLAHDLGHPPFGHAAEEALDEVFADCGGYEGNAQSFRIATKLSSRKEDEDGRPQKGLDLTRASLNAILKYPRLRPATRDDEGPVTDPPDWYHRATFAKAGVYPSEQFEFDEARSALPDAVRDVRSPEAILMDWADDVSYAVHDAEDFFRANLVPLHRLESDLHLIQAHGNSHHAKKPGFEADKFAEALQRLLRATTVNRAYEDGRSDRAALHRFASRGITRYERAIQLIQTPPYVRINNAEQYEVLALMELTWFYVIDRPALWSIQEGQRRIVREVATKLREWSHDKTYLARLPGRLRDLLGASNEDEGDIAMATTTGSRECWHHGRAVADYLSSLTEPQLLDLHTRLTGNGTRSMFGTWI